MRQATARPGRSAREERLGLVCCDCGGRLRLVGHVGDAESVAVFACMRRGCEGRVRVPGAGPADARARDEGGAARRPKGFALRVVPATPD